MAKGEEAQSKDARSLDPEARFPIVRRMEIRSGLHRNHRPYAADPAAPRLGRDRLHHPGQGRVPESRRLGEGPRRAVHRQGRGGARPVAPGRRHRRGHRRQHRDRAGARRQRARLPQRHRHARDAEPGKAGHAAPVRRRSPARARGALRQSDELRALFRDAGEGGGGARSRTARSGRTSSTIWRTGARITKRPGRRSGTTPAARSMASSPRSAPAARLPASPWR